ncbi:hypothetical protein BGZ63DRAFT_415756 [Mariannaea sp. PMI_226]|nr:hypothetical protein BGZ63DRAFT_415756 [Mariannaea sp. PMI_226]
MASPYDYIRLDLSSSDKAQLAEKYKQLRLAALQQSPDAFSSTYEDESKYSDEIWLQRVFNSTKKTFVCVDRSDGSWVAQVSILGPLKREAFLLPDEAGQPEVLSDEEEEKWQMVALYTLPSHRRKGLGKVLCQEAFQHLVETRGGPKKVRVRIMVKPQNVASVKLYQSLDFVDCGRCTLEEALTINGEDIPENPSADKYRVRSGYVMALQLERQ